MFIPLLRTPLARYVPLKASSQSTRHVFPVSAALTRSFATATETKAKKVAPAKANRGKQSKADVKKKNKKPSPPKRPNNSFIRFSAHYYQTHEIKQPVSMAVGDIKRAYEKLTPEEKEKFLPTEQELEDYKTRRAEWVEKTNDAKYKAKLNGYQLYVSDNFPKGVSFQDCSGVMKDVADGWKSLTDDEKAEWGKRAVERYEARNRS